jgi:protein-tyrosine phosphatase
VNISSVLVVCVGNICRSPAAERALAGRLSASASQIKVTSAGIGALVDHPADETASQVAAAHGVSLQGHVARQFTHQLGLKQDLILVMEPGHRREIARVAPDLAGRVMLFDHWQGGEGIPDPYQKSREFHEAVFAKIEKAAAAWAEKLIVGQRK